MHESFSFQYTRPCVVLDETDDDSDRVIDFARGVGAAFEDEPDSEAFVVQFPRRPPELYSESALRRSLKPKAALPPPGSAG